MTDDNNEEELSTYLANEIVSLANSKLGAGLSLSSIATALRHAAANFSAFSHIQNNEDPLQQETLKQEFSDLLNYYLELHAGNNTDE
ncbi:MAG: DUF3144 domain-containing protein [Rhodospirillales bacterium]|jgi:hypothetical protein|nr:DUF3144 domain-containing protein [Rhodospirillales bacterium]